MAQVPVVGVFAFLFLQLAAGQDAACANALMTLTNNMASCTPTLQNPTIICDGVCRGYYDNIFTACPANVSLLVASCIDSLVYIKSMYLQSCKIIHTIAR